MHEQYPQWSKQDIYSIIYRFLSKLGKIGVKMEFLKGFLRNLGLLLIIGMILFILFPDMMKQIFQLYGALLGPIAIIVVIVAALPRKKRRKP